MSYTDTMHHLVFPTSLLLTGLLAGVVGVLLGVVINFVVAISFGVSGGQSFLVAVYELPAWARLLLPAFGGLLVGLIVYLTKSPEIMGEGVPAVKRALREETTIRIRTAPLKFLVTSITIGTGGSAGREGPIIQMGAGLGVSIARLCRLGATDRTLLLLAGAAAAMAAAFGTPAAALIFVVEVLRRQLTYRGVVAMVSTVAIATVVAQGVFSYQGLLLPFVASVPFALVDIPSYIVLGVAAGLIGVLFTLAVRVSHAAFYYLTPSVITRPVVGGLVVGGIALSIPFIYEPAMYGVFASVVSGEWSVVFLITLLIAKIVATAVTVGSGGSGGIFAPSLVIGLVLGGVLASVFSSFGVVTPPAYAYVGMAALFAAAAHAPLTAVFMLYALTDASSLLMPLIIASLIAYVVARYILPESMYDQKESA